MIKVDGKKIAESLKEEIKSLLKESGPKSLAIFYVGNNSVIDSYVALKKRVGEELGIAVEVFRYEESISQDALLLEIQEKIKNFSGAIVQLPLPVNFEKERVLSAIPIEKDVDVLSKDAFEMFSLGKIEKLPPVVSAVNEIFRTYNLVLPEKNIVIVGFGMLVGKPLAAWLSRQGIPYEIVDEQTPDALEIIKNGDIIISGTGIPSLIKKEMVKGGAILIDAGSSTSSGRIVGDIEALAYEKASIASTVPGGVGPITVASLFKNLFLQ